VRSKARKFKHGTKRHPNPILTPSFAIKSGAFAFFAVSLSIRVVIVPFLWGAKCDCNPNDSHNAGVLKQLVVILLLGVACATPPPSVSNGKLAPASGAEPHKKRLVLTKAERVEIETIFKKRTNEKILSIEHVSRDQVQVEIAVLTPKGEPRRRRKYSFVRTGGVWKMEDLVIDWVEFKWFPLAGPPCSEARFRNIS
jgi:hypothetical protein